jgi:hypothetical protein
LRTFELVLSKKIVVVESESLHTFVWNAIDRRTIVIFIQRAKGSWSRRYVLRRKDASELHVNQRGKKAMSDLQVRLG